MVRAVLIYQVLAAFFIYTCNGGYFWFRPCTPPLDMLLACVLLVLQFAFGLAAPSPKLRSSRLRCRPKRKPVTFSIPTVNGGSQLDNAGSGGGEPMNVIISGLSSPAVLTNDGLLNWARSIGFSTECLGFHSGAPQTADLGDGNGSVDQLGEFRQDYGSSELGTCLESLIGGNHFRYWRQKGPLSNSNAIFLAVSQEENVEEQHNIIPNGYDLGRDDLVYKATSQQTTFDDVTYLATSQTISGLLPVGSTGVNHGIALDGNVTLLTITIQGPTAS